ncbi:MAG: diaminopimelate decarboxylase [Planctomycetes bacterium]|nr:diaminopimelate decarboxylase [Planctomycetota bacterium]
MSRPLPVEHVRLARLAETHGTPLYVYHADTIRSRVAQLSSFDVVRYAQKANPNLSILRLVAGQGCAVDAVSAGEVLRALEAGFEPDRIAYTADVFDDDAREQVAGNPIRVNCGSLDMLPALAAARPGAQVTLRVNPGFGHGHAPGVSTGGRASKHGIWHADLPRSLGLARTLGLTVTGLHVHVGSGSDLENLTEAARVFEDNASALRESLRTLSAGGGLPVPYRDGEGPFDVGAHFSAWDAARRRIGERVGRRLDLEVEPGRFLVAESGVLVARVLGTKSNDDVVFVLLDAGFHTLVRPALYGAFHRIVPLTPRGGAPRRTVVAGPLCESGDVFTRSRSGEWEPRVMAPLAPGDLVAIADAGAYGMSMASRYNSQPLPAEVLVDGGEARLIRRRETHQDLWRHEVGD